MRVPRAYSYNGVAPYANRNREVVYSVPDICHPQLTSFKGKDMVRRLGHDRQSLSPTSSKGSLDCRRTESVPRFSSHVDDI